MVEEIARKIKQYLQNDCSDAWSVTIKDEIIVAYYTTLKRFELVYDNECEEWYISSDNVSVSLVSEVLSIVNLYMEQGI